MVDLSDADREELKRLREAFGEPDIEREELEGGFEPLDPMLAETLDEPLDTIDESAWIAEPKYDGTRVLVEKFDDEVRLYTRRGINRFDDVPTLHDGLAALPDGVILDGEFTFITPKGASSFHPIQTGADEWRRHDLTPVLYLFDALYLEGDLTGNSLEKRKQRLMDVVAPSDHVEVAPFQETDFLDYYRELTEHGEEGLILKRVDSRYYRGIRSEQWLKVKQFTERDVIVVGYTPGEGDRSDTFGSLVLSDGDRFIGRVGSGFSETELQELMEEFEPRDGHPFSADAVGMEYTPVEPFVVTVKYQEVTPDGKLRAPVYLHRNPEKPLSDVQAVWSTEPE